MFDGLNDDDGVIDDDADGENEGEQRNCIGREPKRKHHGERADECHRNCNDGNERGPEVAEKYEDHDADEDEGLDERMNDRFDCLLDEHGRVVHDIGPNVVGIKRLQFLENLAHPFRDRDRVRTGRLVDADACRRLAIEADETVGGLGAEFNPAEVLDAEKAPLLGSSHDDLAELFRSCHAATCRDVELEIDIGCERCSTDATNGCLHVLGLDRIGHVLNGNAEAGEPLQIEPNAHGIFLRPEQAGLSNARHAA